jgi:hypothetical protein
MAAWWLVMSVVAVGAIVWAVADPHSYFQAGWWWPRGVIGLVGAAFLLLVVARYLPLALRERRRG